MEDGLLRSWTLAQTPGAQGPKAGGEREHLVYRGGGSWERGGPPSQASQPLSSVWPVWLSPTALAGLWAPWAGAASASWWGPKQDHGWLRHPLLSQGLAWTPLGSCHLSPGPLQCRARFKTRPVGGAAVAQGCWSPVPDPAAFSWDRGLTCPPPCLLLSRPGFQAGQ